MQVDFNNLRVKIARKFNELIAQLNTSELNATIEVSPDETVKQTVIHGDILLNSFRVKPVVDEMRDLLVSLMCCYVPDDDSIQDVSDIALLDELELDN